MSEQGSVLMSTAGFYVLTRRVRRLGRHLAPGDSGQMHPCFLRCIFVDSTRLRQHTALLHASRPHGKNGREIGYGHQGSGRPGWG
jgi:hypothetical protein